MRPRAATFCGFAVAVSLFTATGVHAQQPVCPSPGPGEAIFAACRPFSLFPVVRWLADFTVDHYFKPFPPAFERDLRAAAAIVAGKELQNHEDLDAFLRSLSPLRFSQLDRTTGTLLADFADRPLEQSTTFEEYEGGPTLELRMPPRLEGGYWRGPDVLQIAFWERRRIGFHVSWKDGRAFEGDIACVSVSPDGLLLRLADEKATPVMVLFRECPS